MTIAATAQKMARRPTLSMTPPRNGVRKPLTRYVVSMMLLAFRNMGFFWSSVSCDSGASARYFCVHRRERAAENGGGGGHTRH